MSSISDTEVEAIIVRAKGENRLKILNYKLEPFSAKKCGILGEHFLLSVKCENQKELNAQNRVKEYKFFVKLLGDINQLPKHIDVDVFDEEVNFCNEVQPLMLADYIGEKWYPECYLAKSGILVLEDLREQGFAARTEHTMDKDSLKLAVATLARFHACSVMAEAKIGKPLNEAFPKFFSEKIYSDHNNFGKAVKLGFKTNILIAEKLGLDASLVLPDIYNYISQMVKLQKQEMNVICHSDLHRNNIMFNSKNAAVILDYQLIRYAPPVVDLSILLHLNTTPEFRKTSDSDIIKYYYSVFRDTLQQNKVMIDIPSYEDTIEKYHKYKIVGMATSVDYLNVFYLDPKLLFEIWNDPVSLEKFLLHNRFDFLGPKLETDLDYASKMKDILSEFLAEAKRVLQQQCTQ